MLSGHPNWAFGCAISHVVMDPVVVARTAFGPRVAFALGPTRHSGAGPPTRRYTFTTTLPPDTSTLSPVQSTPPTAPLDHERHPVCQSPVPITTSTSFTMIST